MSELLYLAMKKLSWILGVACFFTLAALFHFLTLNISDADSFYHIRHAWLYRTEGLFQSEFPWVTASVISSLASDLWYGFHLLLIPFTYTSDLIVGIKIAGVFLTAVTLLIFYLTLKKLLIAFPMFWTLLLFFATPDLNFRLTMTRPHLLTLALSTALIYFLSSPRSLIAIFLSSAALIFFHLALGWLPVLIFIVITAVKLFLRYRFEWRQLVAFILGGLLGITLRPNFLNALKLAYIQVVDLLREKLKELPIRIGAELKSVDWSIFFYQMLPVLLLLTAAAIILVILLRKRRFQNMQELMRIALAASLILSIIFGILTGFVARRSMDLWVAYSLIFIGLVFTHFRNQTNFLADYRWLIYGAPLLVIAVMPFNALHFASLYHRQAIAPDKFKEVSLWLKENARAGEVVFNLHWDNFPMLFFWNQKNYYINGMDPIFEYAFNQGLYWKNYFLDVDTFYLRDGKGYTCPQVRCTDELTVPIYETLKNDFKASYVFIEQRRNPKFYSYLENESLFQKLFETNKKEAVFKIL